MTTTIPLGETLRSLGFTPKDFWNRSSPGIVAYLNGTTAVTDEWGQLWEKEGLMTLPFPFREECLIVERD